MNTANDASISDGQVNGTPSSPLSNEVKQGQSSASSTVVMEENKLPPTDDPELDALLDGMKFAVNCLLIFKN